MSNKLDKEHKQPPHFKTPLRKEQLRSLEWMILQESPEAAPFIEEEISEAILDPLDGAQKAEPNDRCTSEAVFWQIKSAMERLPSLWV